MKLAFLNNGIYAYASGDPSAVGGAERQQWLLARALAMKGWPVAVGVRGLVRTGERQTIDGVEFIGLDQGYILSAWARFLRSRRPQWVFWRGADHLLGPAVMVSKLASAGTRTIFSTAFDRDVFPRHALSRRQRWWPLYAWGLLWSHLIFVQHGEQLARLAPRWRAKAVILRSIARRQDAKPHAERERYVVWAAMLRQPKRPDVLAEIARRAPAIRFVVCGGPTTHKSPPEYGTRMMAELRKIPNIEFLGQVAPDKTMQIIADASVLLSTSDEEGFPNTFLEAWASRTPVVTLKIDPDGLIKCHRLGAVSGTVEKAVDDLSALLDSPRRRDEIGSHAQRYIAEQHSEEVITKVFEQALDWSTHSLHAGRPLRFHQASNL